MPISRLHTWIAGEVLTAADLNNEFNNILDNLAITGYIADGTAASPGLQFNNDGDTGLYRPGANRLAIAAGGVQAFEASAYTSGVNYVLVAPGQAGQGAVLAATGSDTHVPLLLTPKGTAYVRVPGGNSISSLFYPGFQVGTATGTGLLSLTTGTIDFVANGVRAFQASAYANATNYLVAVPSQTGQPAILETGGGDTNVPLLLRGKGTGYVQASAFVLENFAATQSPTITGRMYWQSTEGAVHISAGTLIGRVPVLTGVQQGDLIVATNPTSVSGATAFGLVRIGPASSYLMVATGGGALVYGSTRSRIPFTNAASLATGTTRFVGPWADDASETTAFVQHLIPYMGRISALHVKLTTAPGGAEDIKVTVRVNGASVFSTLAITGANVTGSLTTESAPVKPGDYVTFQCTSSAAAAGTTLTGVLEIDCP